MSDDAESNWLGQEYRARLSTQQYGKMHEIEGVRLIGLRAFHDEGGDFCEIGRLSDGMFAGLPHFQARQLNYAYLEPGVIKAWHLHRRQDDLWFVPPADRLLVGLLDVRDDSRTKNARQRFTLGAGEPRLLFIPAGVAHGVANVSGRPASMLYLVSQVFDASSSDEHRLPADLLGADFWSMAAG